MKTCLYGGLVVLCAVRVIEIEIEFKIMCSLLNGIGFDKILDDSFFDELRCLDIDENDYSLTLNEFLGSQSEDFDIPLNQNMNGNKKNNK